MIGAGILLIEVGDSGYGFSATLAGSAVLGLDVYVCGVGCYLVLACVGARIDRCLVVLAA